MPVTGGAYGTTVHQPLSSLLLAWYPGCMRSDIWSAPLFAAPTFLIYITITDGHVGTFYTQFMKRLRIKLRRTRRNGHMSGARRFIHDATGFYAT